MKYKRILIDVDEDLHAMVKIKASKERKTIKEILTALIKNWLKRK
jgi:hypothetical protein